MTCDLILVSYQSGALVRRAIAAARAFMPLNEVIVVNNSAADHAAVTAAQDAGALVVNNDVNRGFAAAVNQGVERSHADYCLLVNPDVSNVRGSVAAIEAIFRRDPRAAAVGVRLVTEDGALQDSCRRAPQLFDFVGESLGLARRVPWWTRPRRFRMLDFDYDRERVVDAVSGAFVVIRREALKEVGEFDERFFVYGEELDWFIRASAAGWRVHFTPHVQAVHRGGRSTDAPATAMTLLLQASWHTYARKHLGRFDAACLRVMLAALDTARFAVAASRRRREAAADALARIPVHFAGGFTRRVRDRFEGS